MVKEKNEVISLILFVIYFIMMIGIAHTIEIGTYMKKYVNENHIETCKNLNMSTYKEGFFYKKLYCVSHDKNRIIVDKKEIILPYNEINGSVIKRSAVRISYERFKESLMI